MDDQKHSKSIAHAIYEKLFPLVDYDRQADTIPVPDWEEFSKLLVPIIKKTLQEIMGDRNDGVCPRCNTHQDEMSRLRAKVQELRPLREKSRKAEQKLQQSQYADIPSLRSFIESYRKIIHRAHTTLDQRKVPRLDADDKPFRLSDRINYFLELNVFTEDEGQLEESYIKFETVAEVEARAEAKRLSNLSIVSQNRTLEDLRKE